MFSDGSGAEDLCAPGRRGLRLAAAGLLSGALAALGLETQMTDDPHRALFAVAAVILVIGALALAIASRRS